jgi:hypothetical protein
VFTDAFILSDSTPQKIGSLCRSTTTSFQSAVASVHFYPFVVVVERTGGPFPS